MKPGCQSLSLPWSKRAAVENELSPSPAVFLNFGVLLLLCNSTSPSPDNRNPSSGQKSALTAFTFLFPQHHASVMECKWLSLLFPSLLNSVPLCDFSSCHCAKHCQQKTHQVPPQKLRVVTDVTQALEIQPVMSLSEQLVREVISFSKPCSAL